MQTTEVKGAMGSEDDRKRSKRKSRVFGSWSSADCQKGNSFAVRVHVYAFNYHSRVFRNSVLVLRLELIAPALPYSYTC